MEDRTPSNRLRFKLWLPILALLIIGLHIFEAHYQISVVLGPSMQPTLHTGDLLLVHRQAYRNSAPARGEIVVARYMGDLIVKRIAGLPGETVKVAGGVLYVNGEPVREKHPTRDGLLEVGKGTLAPGKYAVLGDNRNGSASVLVHGVVSEDQIVGRVDAKIQMGRNLFGLIIGPTTFNGP